MLDLDKKGTHLKYFSQKQDVILIKNLLLDTQHRWEKVVSRSAQRTRQLDHGYKEAKQVGFWHLLINDDDFFPILHLSFLINSYFLVRSHPVVC